MLPSQYRSSQLQPGTQQQLVVQQPRQQIGGQMMQPFDPFEEMDMMLSPFGGRRGGSLLGGGFGGGIFGQMQQMMDDMDRQMAMGGGMGGMGGMGGSSFQMAMSSGNGGISQSTMVFSSNIGADGQVHTEHFSSSAVSDPNRGIREVQQAYSNSESGMDKMSMERHIQDQGRKMVKERNRHTGEERQSEMLRGLEENQASAFDDRWRAEAAPYIPRHSAFMQPRMAISSDSGGYPRGQQSLMNSVPTVSGHRQVQSPTLTAYQQPANPSYGYRRYPSGY